MPNFALAAFYGVGSVRLYGAQQSLSTGGRWLRTAQRLKRGGRGVPLVSGSTDGHRLFPSRCSQTLALSLLPEPGQLCLGMLQPGFHPQLYLTRTARNRSSMESWEISSSQRGSSKIHGTHEAAGGKRSFRRKSGG